MLYTLLRFLSAFMLIPTIRAGDVTNQVFGGIKEGIIAAFGDFNSDELTDVFIITDRKTTVQILYGADTEPLLQPSQFCTFEGYEITSVVPGDFDGDALMDLFVTLRSKKSSDDNILEGYINWGDVGGLQCAEKGKPLLRTKGEPLAIDYNSDMVIDLYGLDEDGVRTFWIFSAVEPRTEPEKFKQTAPAGSEEYFTKMSIPNSNAYLDLNQDFTADLYVQTKDCFEIWYGRHDGKDFTFNKTIKLPIGSPDLIIGQSLFIDLELQGIENIILPACFDEYCKDSRIMVYDDANFVDMKVNFKDPHGDSWGFVPPISTDVYLKTITARSGDFNMDGYPDLLVTLQKKNGNKQKQTFLLQNVPAGMSKTNIKRTFEIKWNALLPMGNDTVVGAFYDFYQDGVLDVIMVENSQNGYRPLAFRNTLDYDANFVKVIVLTGLSNKKNPTQRTPLGTKKRIYGTNLPGPRITYSTTTQKGDEQNGSSVQLSQSSYFALQLPYTIFGLGRTPNFVDSLTVGLNSKSRTWTQLIPNSQIIVIPKGDERYWKAQLFVTPSKLILMSVVALGGTCLFIILVILVLHIKEKREDKQERSQEAHRFHFDAM